ncbi:MAG: polyprenol monophosphomannose synthase [bacterium]
MKTLVVVPTYNEKENIKPLLEAILALKIEGLEILVVDDNSPDKTGEIVDELAKNLPQIKAIHRYSEKGRGLAGIEGFRYGIEKGYDYIMEMDGDFSHNPKYIPDFLREIKDYDLVIGSRYVKGGGEYKRLFIRRIVSRLANFFLKTLLGFKVSDCSSGFRLFKRRCLEEIEIDHLSSKGPWILTEILYKCHQKGYRIKEIPIIFEERVLGKSKLNGQILLHSFFFAFKLRRLNKSPQEKPFYL